MSQGCLNCGHAEDDHDRDGRSGDACNAVDGVTWDLCECPGFEPGGRGGIPADEVGAFGVRCGICGGPVFMATCHHFRGTGHTWAVVGLCEACKTAHWIEGGCVDCAESQRNGEDDQ